MWSAVKFMVVTMAVAAGLVLGCGDRPGAREFQNGIRQFERGHLVRARDLFEKSVNKRPGHEVNAYAHQYLGYIAWQLGEPAPAEAHFENSRRLNPRLFEPVYSQAVMAFNKGDYRRARSLFNEAAHLRTTDPRPLEYLAQTYSGEAGRHDARRLLHQARDRSPQSPRILTALALVELEDHGPAAAASYLMHALENNPNYPPALYNLGRLYADWPDQQDHAIEYYNQYLAVAPESEYRTRARQALARLKHDPPDYDDVEIAAPDVFERTPPRPRTLDDILADAQQLANAGQTEQAVSLCLRAAVEARQNRRVDQEERALRKAVELGPDAARAHVALGRHWAAHNRHTDALRAYRRAVELQDEWTHAYVGLAHSAEALGDYDVALDALTRAVALEPDNPDPLWSLAQLYDDTGVRRRAVDAYQQFRRRFPADPRATRTAERITELQPPAPVEPTPKEPAPAAPPLVRNTQAAIEAFSRGVTYQQRQDWDNALFFYDRAIQLDPEQERAHYNKGFIQRERRNLRDARDAFLQSVEISPNKVAARYNLGLVYYEMNEPQAAVPHLDAALRVDPNFAPAHLLLGLIYAAEPHTHARAKRHYNRYLTLRPDDSGTAAIRDWLARN